MVWKTVVIISSNLLFIVIQVTCYKVSTKQYYFIEKSNRKCFLEFIYMRFDNTYTVKKYMRRKPYHYCIHRRKPFQKTTFIEPVIRSVSKHTICFQLFLCLRGVEER